MSRLSTLQQYLLFVDTSIISILIPDYVSPTPIIRNTLFLSSPSRIKASKPKFRSLLFLVNINNMSIDILWHILVLVKVGLGGRVGAW